MGRWHYHPVPYPSQEDILMGAQPLPTQRTSGCGTGQPMELNTKRRRLWVKGVGSPPAGTGQPLITYSIHALSIEGHNSMCSISHQQAPRGEVVGRAFHRDHGLGWQQKVIVLQLLPSGKTTEFVVWDTREKSKPCHVRAQEARPQTLPALECKP